MEVIPQRIEWIAIVGCLFLYGFIFELIRSNRLKERYSLIWFFSVTVLFFFSLNREWLHSVSRWMGVYYAPVIVILMVLFFMLVVMIHFSTVISRLSADRQRLVQELGLLEQRVRAVESQAGAEGARPR